MERLPDLGGERFLLTGDRDLLLAGDRDLDLLLEGGVLDLVRFRGLLERRLRFGAAGERDRVLLLLRNDRERERLDLGGGDLLRRDKDRLLERLPPVRLAGDRDLERRAGRLDLEWERRFLVPERDRLPNAPPLLGERDLERLVPPRDRDLDLRLLLGDRDKEADLLRLGDRDTFLFGDVELLRRFGETEIELLRPLGDFDFLEGFETFFLGVIEREVERDRWVVLFGDLGDNDGDFLLGLGD